MWLLIAFLVVPIVEIGLFIQVGGLIGLWPTLAIVVLTAVAGTVLVRSQGARALQDLRRSMSDLSDPTEPLAHGAMILLSGALLLTPGFFTDAVGFLLLIPQVRLRAYRAIRQRVNFRSFAMGHGAAQQTAPRDRVIDGEFEEVSRPARKPTHEPSGWTRH